MSQMSPLKIVSGQKGNTLVIILGVAAIVGFLTFELYRRNESLVFNSQQAALHELTDSVMQSIAARLQNADSCTPLLKGQKLNPAKQTEVRLAYRFDPEMPAEALMKNTEVTGGLYLRLITLDLTDGRDMSTDVARGAGRAPLDRYLATLNMIFSNTLGGTEGTVSANRTGRFGIPVYVWLKRDSNVIESCHGIHSAAALCNDLGGYLDTSVADYRQACRFSLQTHRSDGSAIPKYIGSARIGPMVNELKDCKSPPWQATPLRIQTEYFTFDPQIASRSQCLDP